MDISSQLADGQAEAGVSSPSEGLDIAGLTRRLAAGEEGAYRVFYEAYFDRLSRYLLVVSGGDEEAAREALQSAMLRVVRHIRVFPDDAVFWSWLTVLARSALVDQVRKRRRYLAFLDRFRRQAELQQDGTESMEADARLVSLLEGGLAALPADERQLLEWKYYERRAVRDMATELGTSEKAVESKLVRVRRKLKETLLRGLKHE